MPDSMNARRGAVSHAINNKHISPISATAAKMKLTNIEFRNLKKSIKERIQCDKENLVTSEYFEHFDSNNPKTMNYRQQHYLRIAAETALKSDMNHKHGAVIVHKKTIIAYGYNYFDFNNLISIHAEVDALSKIKGKYKDILCQCELYVARIGPENLNSHLKYSKPCNNCQNYISKKCIKKTYYSTNYDYDETIANYLYLKQIGFDTDDI